MTRADYRERDNRKADYPTVAAKAEAAKPAPRTRKADDAAE